MADKEQDYKPSLAQRWKKFNQADDSGMTLKEETRRAAMRGLLWYHDGVSFMPFAVITMATGLSLILPVAHHNNYEPQALLEQSDMDISLTQGYDTTFGYRAVELPDGQTIMVVRDENDVWRVYQERPFDSKVDEAWSQGAEELTYIEDSAEAYAAIIVVCVNNKTI
jgi:hypothetical protein